MDVKQTKSRIIQAGQKAVDELIKIAEEEIITEKGTMIVDGEEILINSGDEITADRLKNAAATKKLAIFDAFEILDRIVREQNLIDEKEPEPEKEFKGFAERRSK